MGDENVKKFYVKSDLKKLKIIAGLDNEKFENEDLKQIYLECKNCTQLEYRVKECVLENYFFFDLSNLEMTENDLEKIENEYKDIFEKIELLDISENNLSSLQFIEKYENIKYVTANNNNIVGTVCLNNIVELNCENNKIEAIKSDTILYLVANNNLIVSYDIPNLKQLNIWGNPLENIQYQISLKYLTCSTNRISVDYEVSHIEKVGKIYFVEF